MSDYNIDKMDFKQLRNEVQLLRDELAIMKRKYEDLLYNLDTDNFSQRIVKQSKDMYTKIEQTAEEITLQAEKVDANETNIATLQVTAKEISSEVTEVKNDVSTNSTKITQNANAISAVVRDVNNVSTQISDVSQTADRIKTTVSSVFKEITKVSNKKSMTDTSKIYSLNGVNYHYNDVLDDWDVIEGNSIASSFVQTDNGFVLTGDVKITEIAQVGGDLYIGSYDDDGSHKRIHFNERAWIGTASDGVGGTAGCSVSAANFNMIMQPSRIYFIDPDNTSNYISLADYVSENGGGGTVTAVFA